MAAMAHPKIDSGSCLKLPGEVILRDVLHRNGNAVYNVTRAVRWIVSTQESSSATRSLPICTKNQIRDVELTVGKAERWLLEVDLLNITVQSNINVLASSPRQQRSEKIGAMNHKIWRLVNKVWVGYRRRL